VKETKKLSEGKEVWLTKDDAETSHISSKKDQLKVKHKADTTISS
jgi:hypothetical protein